MSAPSQSRISWGYRIAAAGAAILCSLPGIIFLGCFDWFPIVKTTGCEYKPEHVAFYAVVIAMTTLVPALTYIALVGKSPVGEKMTAYLTRRWSGP